jgi:predicted RNA binding protein YcfA (HicA-like mRNA interferase family)
MSKLPQVSGPELVRALEKLGFSVRRQHGSHIIMRRDDPYAQTVVPNHRQIDRGTLRAILRQIGITPEDLTSLLVGDGPTI